MHGTRSRTSLEEGKQSTERGNKPQSIVAETLSRILDVNAHWMDTFVASKKKDDLADTVLQALSYINRRVVSSEKKVPDAKKKVTARQPNENQKATKYSVSNLAWLAKHETRAKLEADKRFVKDLKRYYKDFDELLSVI